MNTFGAPAKPTGLYITIGLLAIVSILFMVLFFGNLSLGWFREKLVGEGCTVDETDATKSNCAEGLNCAIDPNDPETDPTKQKKVCAAAGTTEDCPTCNDASTDTCGEFCDCPEGVSAETCGAAGFAANAETCATGNFCSAESGSSVGGTTKVQLCDPWKAQDCPRAGAELTCDEFHACRKAHGQSPCGGDAWFKKCGWGN